MNADHTSYLKARFCKSVMGTSTISPDEEAKHLLGTLATETPTPGASPQVADAEASALAAIQSLVSQLKERSVSFASADWVRAKNAIDHWIATAS